MEINRLYPQYDMLQERRQKVAPISPVSYERRSGMDRRGDDRIKLDTTLTRDIFEIKSKVAQLENFQQKNVEKVTFGHNITKVAQNLLKTDQFVKLLKPTLTETPKEIVKSKSNMGTVAGLLGVVLGGTLASAFLGGAGVGIVIGLGAYFGAKFIKSAIVSHFKDK